MRAISSHLCLLLLVALAAVSGCSSMKPGNLDAIRPETDRERAGSVFLLRGFIGIFSTGIDSLGQQINDSGVHAEVFQDDQWRTLASTIAQRYAAAPGAEPLVLIGHSYGADDVVRIARELDDKNVRVDLLITLDPVTPPAVTKNVVRAYNLYQSNGAWDSLPWLRGVPLNTEDGFTGSLENLNIRTHRTDLLESGLDHFNIEKKAKIHSEVIKQILATCPPRERWTAMQRRNDVPSVPSPPLGVGTSPRDPTSAGDAAFVAESIPETRTGR